MRQEKDGGIDTYSHRTHLEIAAPWIVTVVPVCAGHQVRSDHYGHEQGPGFGTGDHDSSDVPCIVGKRERERGEKERERERERERETCRPPVPRPPSCSIGTSKKCIVYRTSPSVTAALWMLLKAILMVVREREPEGDTHTQRERKSLLGTTP